MHVSDTMANDRVELTEKKSKRKPGRPLKYQSVPEQAAMVQFLSRCHRYGRQCGPNGFAVALAMWREFTELEITPPLLRKLSVRERAMLEHNFAVAAEELDEPGLPAPISKLASRVASTYFYPHRDPLRKRAMKAMEKSEAEAEAREYWSGVPAMYVPHTGKVG